MSQPVSSNPILSALSVKRELLIVLAVWIAVAAVMTNLKTFRIDQMSGDSAMFFQVTENIAKRGVPESGIYVNVREFRDQGIVVKPASAIATDPLAPPPVPEGNILRLHTYLILYPLALVAEVLPVETTLEASFVLSFTGLIVLSYLVLRSKGVSVGAACLFGALVAANAAWADSLLSGQFFPDRIFVLTGFVLLVLLSRSSVPRWALILALALCAATTERGVAVAGIVLLAHVVLYWRTTGDRSFKLGLGAATLVVAYVFLKFVTIDSPNGAFLPGGVGPMIAMFQNPAFAGKALFLIEMSLPLLVLALFEWRAAAIAFVTMVPNLIGNIGGAEKTGWATHYHSYYLPVLAWAAMQGYANLYRLAALRRQLIAFYAASAVLVLLANSIDPLGSGANVTFANVGNNFFARFYAEARTYPGPTAPDYRALAEEIQRAVPIGSAVSSPEATMSELYRDRTVYFIPIGIDRADYAIMAVTLTPGKPPLYSGIPSFLGADEMLKVNVAVEQRLRRDGYDVDHPKLVPAFGIAIFHRPH